MQETDSLFQVRIAEDRMAVFLDCTALPQDWEKLAAEIEQTLEARKVTCIPPRENLIKILKQAAAGGAPPQNIVIARGKAPGKAVHGRVEWAGDYFTTGFVVDKKTGTVNYRRHAAQSSVQEGQLLGRQIPSRDGDPGTNVFGDEVPGEKARIMYPAVGANVLFDKMTESYISRKSGRVRLVNDTLFVDEVVVIDGSIGLETGDVVHPGAVIVREDVLEGSCLEAGGDIEVFGVVEAATIRAGGNLRVRGGILRCKATKIKVAGAVQVQFIIDSHVEAGRDVMVEKEVINSEVKTFGSVVMPRGRIVGGCVAALRGIVVGQVNTPAYVTTHLIAGDNEMLLDTVHALKDEVTAVEKRLVELHTRMFQFIHLSYGPNSKRTQQIQELQEQIVRETGNLEEQSQKLIQTRAYLAEKARRQIQIEKRLYPGTLLCLGEDVIQVNESVPGPVRAEWLDGRIQLVGRQDIPT